MKQILAGSVLGAALICVPLGAQTNKDNATNKDTVMNVTGCLAHGDSKNEYMLKDESGTTFGLRPEVGVDLKAHLRHKITSRARP